nr:glycosyltransferase [Acetobacter oeni]
MNTSSASAPGIDVAATNITPREAILHREIARLMCERDDLRATRTELEERAEKLKAEADRLPGLEAECQHLRAENIQLTTFIQAFYQSTSWRLTKPLRRAVMMLRGLSDTGEDGVPALPAASQALIAAAPDVVAADLSPALSVHPRIRGHILVVADMLPLYDQHSGGLRLLNIIDILNKSGWKIIFLSAFTREQQPGTAGTPEGRKHYEDALERLGVIRVLYGADELASWICDGPPMLDRAFISFYGIALNFMPFVRLHFPDAVIIFDMVDFHGVRQEREALVLGDDVKLAEARRVRDVEVEVALAADVTLAVTADEREAVLALAPRACVRVLPNVFEIDEAEPPGVSGRKDIFFIGGFWHTPNGDGVLWFVREVWPLIREALPDVRFTIAGSNMGNEILALCEIPGVDVVGYIPEVQPYLDSHRIFVAPLRFGAGMKGKVGQSLAGGLPVVATGVGAEGMGLEDGVDILVEDDPAAFAEAVIRLYLDDELWTRLSVAGRNHIINTLSRKVVEKTLREIIGG